MQDSPRVIKRQREMLERAREGALHPMEIFEYIYEVTEKLEKGALDPEWLDIWARHKETFTKMVPGEVLKRIEKVFERIERIEDKLKSLHLAADDRICFLLGAGASAPAPSSIPTVNNLLPELWRRARRIGRDEIDKLMTWCETHGVKNIEDLLTAAYIANFAAKNSSITGLLDFFLYKRSGATEQEEAPFPTKRQRATQIDASSISLLQDTLQTLFGLLTGTMIPAKPNRAHESVATFLTTHGQSAVVTTNYDGCIDEAIVHADVPINTLIEEGKESTNGVRLIKIHGSINWSYCDSCHDVREFDLLNMKEAYDSDSASYAVIGICKRCQGQRRPLLIPPLGLKFIMFPTLIRLWDAARETIEKSRVLVVVGYSFSEADTYINKILERSMTVNDRQVMVICDPNSTLAPSLRARFTARVDGFDQGRIMHAIGSAEKVLPQVLSILNLPSDKTQPDSVASGAKVLRRRKDRQQSPPAYPEGHADAPAGAAEA